MKSLGILALAVTLLSAHNTRQSSSIDKLYCGGVVRVAVDAGEDVYVRKAVLSGRMFTAWVDLRFTGDALKRDPRITLKEGAGIAYQLDDAGVTAIHPLVSQSQAWIALTFPSLKSGAHRLRIGLLDEALGYTTMATIL